MKSKVVFALVMALVCVLAGCSADRTESAGGADSAEHARWNPQLPTLAGKNLVPNSGFECGPSGWASIGIFTGWGGDLSGLYGEVEDSTGWQGGHCFRIDLGPGITPVTYADAYPSARVVQAAPLVANIGWISVEPGQPYTLSAYMKANRSGVPAKLGVRIGNNPKPFPRPLERLAAVTLTEQWARYSFTLQSEEPQVFVTLGPDLTGTPGDSATVWIDAIQFEPGSEATDYAPREDVEIGVYTDAFDNVLEVGKPLIVHVHGANAADTLAAVTATASFTDYFGNALPDATAQLTLGPKTSVAVPLALPVSGAGFCKGTVTWTAGGVEHREPMRIGIVRPYTESDSPFGINHAPATDELCRSLTRMGLCWTRDCSFDWNQLEPAQGQLTFEKTDIQVDRERAVGLNVLALAPVFASTEWTTSAPDTAKSEYPWSRLSYAPKDPELLYAFVRSVATHYRGRVSHYEFINEPYWIPSGNLNKSAGYTVMSYIELLKGAYAAFKAADPACVVLGGLAIQAEMPVGDEFILQGGLNYVDVLNLHPYPGVSKPESFIPHMERIRKAMDTVGIVRPIWATETGYFCVEDEPWTPFTSTGETTASGSMHDERQTADYVIRHALVLLAHGVEKVFYHEGIEAEVNNGTAIQGNAFWAASGAPQKLYVAMSALTNLLGPAPRFAAKWTVPEPADKAVYGYAFQCGDRALLAAWAPDADGVSRTWRLSAPEGAELYDTVGNGIEAGQAVLGESVVYVVSRTLKAEDLARACTLVEGR